MSTLPVANTLASIFMPIGWAGAIFAIICAIVVLIALASGAAGLTGGAIGVWFIGALLSVLSSFAGEWMPVMLSGAALAAALIIGGMVRMLALPLLATRRIAAARPVVESAVGAVAPAASSQAITAPTGAAHGPAPRTQSVRTQPVGSSGSPVTA